VALGTDKHNTHRYVPIPVCTLQSHLLIETAAYESHTGCVTVAFTRSKPLRSAPTHTHSANKQLVLITVKHFLALWLEEVGMLTRRTLLVNSSAAAIANFMGSATAQTSGQRIRYNAGSAEGKTMLRIYAAGVKTMKALSAQDQRSWEFQWYIHATPKPVAQILNTVYPGGVGATFGLATATWYTCQAHLGQPEDYFLPWHRLYVLQFEQVIRSVTGHDEFTLPYWDYTASASYAIPEEFQAKYSNDPVLSALFVGNRNKDGGQLRSADVNAGEPLNKHYTGARNFLVLPTLKGISYSSFCNQLDGNLHGAIHVFTGDPTNMGQVPTAAGDPVFWLHHCN
jgi:tyrosinase